MVEGTGLENVGGRLCRVTVSYPASKFKGFYYGELPCESTKWKVSGRWMLRYVPRFGDLFLREREGLERIPTEFQAR